MGKHAKLKEKQKWSNEKLHLENARKLRGIYFIDPEDKEFKETFKNARKKLETTVAPAMLEELWRQQQDFREVHQQNLTEMKELRKFQSSTFDTLTRQKFIEDQNTMMELSRRVQELQNEVNCMNDSKDFQDAESVRSGNSHVTSQPGLFPKHPPFEGLLRPSFVSPRRTDGPPNIWDTHGTSGNVFVNPDASSSAPYPQELNPWSSGTEEPLHSSTVQKSERPEQNQDQRCQSGPSAKDSVIFSGGDYPKNYGADQQRLQISDLHFDKFPTPATFACWKIRFKTEECTCSQFPTEALQWMTRGMGSPRQACNRRRRTREGPEPACVRAPTKEGGTRRGGRMN